MRSPFFALFWGWLAYSGIEPLINNAKAHLWGRCLAGLAAITWTGWNAYQHARPPPTEEEEGEEDEYEEEEEESP